VVRLPQDLYDKLCAFLAKKSKNSWDSRAKDVMAYKSYQSDMFEGADFDPDFLGLKAAWKPVEEDKDEEEEFLGSWGYDGDDYDD